MMAWPEVQFETLFSEPQRNGLYKEKQFHGSGAKIVNMGELFAYRFLGPQDMQRVQISDSEYRRFGLQDGDLLFARRSLIESGAGKCVIVEDVNEEMVFESSLIRVRLDQEKCSSRFYLYYFSCPPGRSQVEAIITGAAQKGIRGTDLARIVVHSPPLSTQQKIAAILSAYDDLIENDLRRIKILDEMGQNLYREWFVKFRFPGHEHTHFTDSVLGPIPEKWEVKRLDELAGIRGGKQLGKEEIREVGKFPVFGGNGIQGYSGKATHKGFVIAFGRVGAYCGAIHWSYGGAWLNNNSSSIVPLKHDELILHQLLDSDFTSLRGGAAQPFISNTALAGIELVFPGDALAAQFCSLTHSLHLERVTLERSITTLRRTRDLLLPRLISGEVDVSELDIAVPEEAMA